MHVCDACSVQYLEQPEKVFSEIYRVLKPGGVAIISFSNRLFYEKAISAWRLNTDYGRQQLVKSYFQSVSGFSTPEVVTKVRERACSRSHYGLHACSRSHYGLHACKDILGMVTTVGA
jgi:ubiquinone/menaquinone biosynthesis C-methylase UbiE